VVSSPRWHHSVIYQLSKAYNRQNRNIYDPTIILDFGFGRDYLELMAEEILFGWKFTIESFEFLFLICELIEIRPLNEIFLEQ
jgi:hypothetical protein